MNYNTFISNYPKVVLGLEIFKEIMPTLVALLAIYVNNSRANKREKQKIMIDMKLKALLALQDDISEIDNILHNTQKEALKYIDSLKKSNNDGKELGDLLQRLDDDNKMETHFNRYYQSNEELLSFARKIKFRVNIEMTKLNINNMEFEKCFNIIEDYNNKISNIIEKCRYECDDIEEPLTNIRNQLRGISNNVEDEITNYNIKLAEVIININ